MQITPQDQVENSLKPIRTLVNKVTGSQVICEEIATSLFEKIFPEERELVNSWEVDTAYLEYLLDRMVEDLGLVTCFSSLIEKATGVFVPENSELRRELLRELVHTKEVLDCVISLVWKARPKN